MAAGRRACATAATGPATSPGTVRTAPTAGPGAAAAEAPSATGWNRIDLLLAVFLSLRFLICHCNFEGVTELVTLPASAPRLTEEIASVEAAEVTAEEAASATSATGSGTSPGSAARRRTGATSATAAATSPGTVARRRTPATTATRWGTWPGTAPPPAPRPATAAGASATSAETALPSEVERSVVVLIAC